ncbi:hypothetical protein A3G53_02085 [Candidatus Nomurabacteria bacterium RIFCSPLOWO2_12_FULL_44_11]|uniref:Uncharacterized protein n=1 Tax=Candidatus Nomurabacteria bacterium RIFCSPLOWO2_12_FULL_44_11 TaxID=1801796 RepID=A0A1F6Y759_9BACT|nr:MAG: hypothetical protein A3G53_02085 [Candidatus Nomurabacteria bacterium RIFCSPLOWO2_12_FULL_44_11]
MQEGKIPKVIGFLIPIALTASFVTGAFVYITLPALWIPGAEHFLLNLFHPGSLMREINLPFLILPPFELLIIYLLVAILFKRYINFMKGFRFGTILGIGITIIWPIISIIIIILGGAH